MSRVKKTAPGQAEISGEEIVKKRKKYVKYSPLSLILLSACAFVFCFSMFGLLEQVLLDAAGESAMGDLSHTAFGDGTGNTDPSAGGEITPGSSTVGTWQQISPTEINPENLPYLQTVDFAALKKENSDTVAWMYWPTTAEVKGFPFNLPVVQTVNNEYYLTRSFDKSNSDNGWVYADYRNDMSDLKSNRNLIFYGHARSYLIFGGLKYLNTKSAWQQDGYNHFIYVNTPTERSVWQVFSWYETTVDFNYINTYFSDDAEYVDFLNQLQAKNEISAFEKFNFTGDDRILTLSTCKGNNDRVRVAVHAVLVKYETSKEPEIVDPGAVGTVAPEDDPDYEDYYPEEDSGGELMPEDPIIGDEEVVPPPVTDPAGSGSKGSGEKSSSAGTPAPAVQDGGTPADG